MAKNFWQKLKKNFVAVAPMAGITDSGFRLICKKYGADVVYTEMVSIDALYYDSKKTLKMLEFNKKEKPVVVQLFGKRPELVAKAVKKVEEAGFDGIDINFGCPARKVVGHGGGVSLLRDLDLCYELVKAVCDNTKLPVSVKTRTSIKKGNKKVTVLDFIETLKDLPVSCLMLHGRSYEQGFVDEVDYELMKQAREKFDGVFIANGGINTPEVAQKIMDRTNADGVGLARGLYGKPYLCEQVSDQLKKGKYKIPDLKKIKKIVLEHAGYNFKSKGEHGIIEMRKHLCWYFKGFPQAAKLRKKLVEVTSIDDIKKSLEAI